MLHWQKQQLFLRSKLFPEQIGSDYSGASIPVISTRFVVIPSLAN
jgi:hypothetical protein